MPDFASELNMPHAHPAPLDTALFKSQNADFKVTEVVASDSFQSGEHACFYIESSGDNTQWVAGRLADILQCRQTDVGFCGLKDRNAITRQWFSIYDPKRKITPAKINDISSKKLLASHAGESRILEITRSRAKLRRGVHSGNQFDITLRFTEEPSDALETRLALVAQNGVPNYFGAQRFGHSGNNLVQFQQWLDYADSGRRQRKPRGIVLSAARSFLFNRVLAKRVAQSSWATLLEGESDSELLGLEDELLMPSGPLWGRGRSLVSGSVLALENEALKSWVRWMDALEHLGLKQERRCLVCQPSGFNWCLSSDKKLLRIKFFLPPGQYATSVLREIANISEPSRSE